MILPLIDPPRASRGCMLKTAFLRWLMHFD